MSHLYNADSPTQGTDIGRGSRCGAHSSGLQWPWLACDERCGQRRPQAQSEYGVPDLINHKHTIDTGVGSLESLSPPRACSLPALPSAGRRILPNARLRRSDVPLEDDSGSVKPNLFDAEVMAVGAAGKVSVGATTHLGARRRKWLLASVGSRKPEHV